MSSELILRLFDTVDARRWSDLHEFFHPDIVYERPGYEPLRGFAEVSDFYERRRILARGRHIIEGSAVEGDRGACWGRFEGATRDDVPVDERFADVYTFADGKIRTRRSHFFRPAV